MFLFKKINKKILPSLLILSILFAVVFFYHNRQKDVSTDTSFAEIVISVPKPTFSEDICNILDYGASADSMNTRVFYDAIEDCYSKGGGIVEVPEGIWTTGAIHLRDNINLHLKQGATILFSDNPDDYLPIVETRFIGLELYNYSPMIYAKNCQNVAITGQGIIDGNGRAPGWIDFIKNQKKAVKRLYRMTLDDVPVSERIFGTKEDSLRPSLIQSYDCNNVLIDGVTIKEGPMWTVHGIYTNNLTVSNTNIQTEGPNTDGIVIDSSINVLIENNKLSTGDDSISIKSGRDKDGWRVNKPSKDIIIKNNTVSDAHAGLSIGSEMSGGVENVTVDNLNVLKADRGVRLKTTTGRGGFIRNVLIKNSSFHTSGSKEVVQIDMDYGSSTMRPKTKRKPVIENIIFDNIRINANSKNSIEIVGLKNNISDISFNNVFVENLNQVVKMENSELIEFNNVSSSIYLIENSKNITIQSEACPEIQNENSKNIITTCNQ